MTTLLTLLILAAFVFWFIVLGYERNWWHLMPDWACTLPRKLTWLAVIIVVTALGADKSPVPRLLRMLLWDNVIGRFYGSTEVPQERTVTEAAAALDGAETNLGLAASHAQAASNLLDAVISAASTSQCWTVDVDWPLASRYDLGANVLVAFSWSQPTNVNGVLYDDHFLSFSQEPGDVPQMLFDYHDQTGTTQYVAAVTNSFPTTSIVLTQSGVQTCYWFRCEVPVAFTNCVRTWDDEARLGGPIGSGQGFDIAGTLLLDNGGTLYQGRTLTTTIGGQECEFQHGLLLDPRVTLSLAAQPEEEERSLWSRLVSALPRRAPLVIHTPSNIVVVTGSTTNIFPLAFKKETPK